MLLWGYLSCADRVELQKLYKISSENQIIRDARELVFNQPLPFTQSRESRTLSALYVAVATGSLECLLILFEELTNIQIEHGLEIRKRQKDDTDSLMLKAEKTQKKRTPLQMACALGLYKIVEFLLGKGANANGI